MVACFRAGRPRETALSGPRRLSGSAKHTAQGGVGRLRRQAGVEVTLAGAGEVVLAVAVVVDAVDHDDALAVLDGTGDGGGAEVDSPVVMDRASRRSGEAIYGQGTVRAGVAAGGEGLLDRSIGRGTLRGGEPEVAVGVVEDARALVA